MKEKLTLKELKVKSFVCGLEKFDIAGGRMKILFSDSTENTCNTKCGCGTTNKMSSYFTC